MNMKDQTRQEQELLDTEGVGYETRVSFTILHLLIGIRLILIFSSIRGETRF